MQIVPLRAIPNQQVQSQLNGQACTLNVYQQAFGLYVDVYLGSQLIVAGVIAENLNRIVRGSVAAISEPGFVGDFSFLDLQGADDPVYTGLGSRWVLLYLLPGELRPT